MDDLKLFLTLNNQQVALQAQYYYATLSLPRSRLREPIRSPDPEPGLTMFVTPVPFGHLSGRPEPASELPTSYRISVFGGKPV